MTLTEALRIIMEELAASPTGKITLTIGVEDWQTETLKLEDISPIRE